MSYSWDRSAPPVFSGALKRKRQRHVALVVLAVVVAVTAGLSLIGHQTQPQVSPTAGTQAPTTTTSKPFPATAQPTGADTASGQALPVPPEASVPQAGASQATASTAPSADIIREPVLENVEGAAGRSPVAAGPSEMTDPSVAAAAEVRKALQAWAEAWSLRDFEAYRAAYVPGFKGAADSHETWLAQRRDRIVPRKRIEVVLTDVVIAVDGAQARVDFRQLYAADNWRDDTRRTIQMQRLAEGWRIAGESSR